MFFSRIPRDFLRHPKPKKHLVLASKTSFLGAWKGFYPPAARLPHRPQGEAVQGYGRHRLSVLSAQSFKVDQVCFCLFNLVRFCLKDFKGCCFCLFVLYSRFFLEFKGCLRMSLIVLRVFFSVKPNRCSFGDENDHLTFSLFQGPFECLLAYGF